MSKCEGGCADINKNINVKYQKLLNKYNNIKSKYNEMVCKCELLEEEIDNLKHNSDKESDHNEKKDSISLNKIHIDDKILVKYEDQKLNEIKYFNCHKPIIFRTYENYKHKNICKYEYKKDPYRGPIITITFGELLNGIIKNDHNSNKFIRILIKTIDSTLKNGHNDVDVLKDLIKLKDDILTKEFYAPKTIKEGDIVWTIVE